MRVAGGIVAIISGVFGTIAAGFTLFLGGVASAFEAEGSGTVVGLGWGGVTFSFAVIILGAIATATKSRIPGVLLVFCALAGAVLGGTFVAVFMALALVGGILVVIGGGETPKAPAAQTTAMAGWQSDPTRRHEQRYWDGVRWTEHVTDGGIQSSDRL